MISSRYSTIFLSLLTYYLKFYFVFPVKTDTNEGERTSVPPSVYFGLTEEDCAGLLVHKRLFQLKTGSYLSFGRVLWKEKGSFRGLFLISVHKIVAVPFLTNVIFIILFYIFIFGAPSICIRMVVPIPVPPVWLLPFFKASAIILIFPPTAFEFGLKMT